MTIVANRLTVVDFNNPDGNPVDPPAYVSARVLAANTAENITIPPGVNASGQPEGIASYVRIAANADVFYSFSGAASVPAADIDDGSASELIKVQGDAVWRKVPPGATALSVVSAGVAIVTASFYIT